MNPSFEAQALIRRSVEEQNVALNEFCAWEASIKQNDEEIKEKKSTISLSRQQRHVIPTKLETVALDENLVPQNISSHSIVIGGHEPSKSEVPVAKAPHLLHETSTINPNNGEGNFEELERQRGNESFSKGDYDEAVKHYTRCIQQNPSSVLAYSNRGKY